MSAFDRDPNEPPVVLVVEDEPRLREMLLRAVPDMGFQAVGARSGEEAVKLLETAPDPDRPGVAILDLNLPGLSGLDLLKTIRDRWPRTAVLILTGFGDLAVAKQAIRLDVTDFLTKPCALGDLEVALDRARRRWVDAAPHGKRLPPRPFIDEEPAEKPEPPAPADEDLPKRLEDLERRHILAALDRHHGNRTTTAAELGISLRTLYYRLSEYQKQGFIKPT